MSRLNERAQFAVIIGLFIGYKILSETLLANPSTAALGYGVIGIYLFFVLTTWAGKTIFNAALFLHPLGRHALSRDEKIQASLSLTCFASGGAAAAAHVFSGNSLFWAAAFPFVCVPITAAFNTQAQPKRLLGYAVVAGFYAACLVGLVSDARSGVADWGYRNNVALSIALFTWVGNLIFRDRD